MPVDSSRPLALLFSMSLQLSDEPLHVLSALHEAIKTVKCNKQSRVYFDMLHEQLSELQPQLSSSIESMKEEAAYGQTLKQSQLKGLQVGSLHVIQGKLTAIICV